MDGGLSELVTRLWDSEQFKCPSLWLFQIPPLIMNSWLWNINRNVLLSVEAKLPSFPWALFFFYLVLSGHRCLRWFKTNGQRERQCNEPWILGLKEWTQLNRTWPDKKFKATYKPKLRCLLNPNRSDREKKYMYSKIVITTWWTIILDIWMILHMNTLLWVIKTKVIRN